MLFEDQEDRDRPFMSPHGYSKQIQWQRNTAKYYLLDCMYAMRIGDTEYGSRERFMFVRMEDERLSVDICVLIEKLPGWEYPLKAEGCRNIEEVVY